MLLSDLTAPTPYREIDYTDAMAVTTDELRASILAVIDVRKGDKTALRGMRKPLLARMSARAIYILTPDPLRVGAVVKKGPRPRKRVETRAERKARGNRKDRRAYTKARKHRDRDTNIHHKIGGR